MSSKGKLEIKNDGKHVTVFVNDQIVWYGTITEWTYAISHLRM